MQQRAAALVGELTRGSAGVTGENPCPCMMAVARELDINLQCSVGMLPVRKKPTKVHAHVLGVIHFLGKGRKRWRCWRPGAVKPPARPSGEDDNLTPGCIEIEQHEGDLIYIPPGWWHEVTTLEGEHVAHSLDGVPHDMCLHWVVWAWPLASRAEALGQWACGWVREQQSSKDVNGAVRMAMRERMWEPLLQSM